VEQKEKKKRSFSQIDYLVFILLVVSVAIFVIIRYNIFNLNLQENTLMTIQRLLAAIVVICVTWIALHFIGSLFEKIGAPAVGGEAQAKSIWKIISYIIWIVVIGLLALGIISNPDSWVLFIGLIGAALAFVMQQPLLNIAGWFLISTRGLYRLGDRISLSDVSGYVVDITIMQTEVREFGEWMDGDTFTGRIVAVPNAFIFSRPVFNYTKDVPFIHDEVGFLVTFDSDISVAKSITLEAAKEVIGKSMERDFLSYQRVMEFSDLKKQITSDPQVRMDFAESGVRLFVIYFCPAESRRLISSRITEEIWRRFGSDSRVRLAVPHRFIRGSLDERSFSEK
jgi:small-conductance mechanosensitive channel